ncbi:hypothetical protein ULMA_27210 [Patiriisocius marinus]|uniref:Uncharacterized protein n=2 Tax=Patiriisocius marinus TaxID=1397112 RepID=A0A5J4J3Z4_9FLAO|nr:hypothetical protein ULMA_27210 [Patiriisocius marinus]
MYTLQVTNNYIWPITASDKTVIPAKGAVHTFNSQGNIFLEVMGIGSISFIDLGDKKIEGYPNVKETWGVLVRTHATEAYYRYEGGGVLNTVFDLYGTCTLTTTNGTLIPISLEEMIITPTGLPTT